MMMMIDTQIASDLWDNQMIVTSEKLIEDESENTQAHMQMNRREYFREKTLNVIDWNDTE